MPSIDLLQTRTNEAGGIFRTVNLITDSTDIPKELFVYRQFDDVFSHVAGLVDFYYPNVNTPGFEFYRQDNATKDYDNVENALEFANSVKSRLAIVLAAYTDNFVDFPGSETTTIPTP